MIIKAIIINAGFAVSNSGLFQTDIENGCMADSEGQDHIQQHMCNENITDSTVGRIKNFTETVHKDKFGLVLPVIPTGGKSTPTRVRPDSKLSWVDGVLPFYAATNRRNEHTKDADLIGYLLDIESRC